MKCENCNKKVYANETCTCGLKAPKKSNGAVRLNTVICFFLLFISTLCLIVTLSLRTIVTDDILVDAVRDIKITEIEVSDGDKIGKVIAESINSNIEFIDNEVSEKQVNELLEDDFIKDELVNKLEEFQGYVLDKNDAPQITADEITEILDSHGREIEKYIGFEFKAEDKEYIEEELSTVLDDVNEFIDNHVDTYFGSKLIHTFFSSANVVFLIALIAVIFIQWLVVYLVNSRRAGKMFFKFGLAVFIPSLIILAGVVTSIFIPTIDVLDELLETTKYTFLKNALIMLFVGIFFTVIGIMLNRSCKKSKTAAKTAQDGAVNQTVVQNKTDMATPLVVNDLTETNAVTSETVDLSEVKTDNAVPNKCSQCSFVNKEGAAFCSRCGTKL